MGKLEILGMIVALAGIVGVQTLEPPVEDHLIDTAGALMSMTKSEFQSWCDNRGVRTTIELDESQAGTLSCAWIDRDTERAWHAALHFDGIHQAPVKADAGLVDASESTVIRLVQNEFGAQDAKTGEGFLVWEVEHEGQPKRLTVAPFEDITVVRMSREPEPAVVSMR